MAGLDFDTIRGVCSVASVRELVQNSCSANPLRFLSIQLCVSVSWCKHKHCINVRDVSSFSPFRSPKSVLGDPKKIGHCQSGTHPHVALDPSIELHDCWPFHGSRGFLGIRLNYDIYVEGVAVDYIPMDFTLNRSSSPRQMRLWGIIPEDASEQIFASVNMSDFTISTTQSIFESSRQSSTVVLLADFVYNANARESLQNFPVFFAIQMLNTTFNEVMVEVLSNWGIQGEHLSL